MDSWQLIFLAVLGVVAGILNVIAGGGSLLTLPTMVIMGMEGPTANGTNRVAILAQNLTAVTSFKSKGFSDFKLSLSLALMALPGGIAGAWCGTLIRGVLFNRILAGIMIGILILTFIQERRKTADRDGSDSPAPPATKSRMILGHVCMIGVGFYGGFIQAGVGFLLMAVLKHVMHVDLVRVNMHKVFIIGIYTIAALAVFVKSGNVLWVPGIALAVGNSLGGWIGSQLSISKGETFIRRVLYVTLAVMSVKLLVS
ncbi:MAG: hypothetical protein CMO80_14805 [Verrucomicrobiales bacterium]|nr:hypothetical protein [Verrucomicrobiales bacterium]